MFYFIKIDTIIYLVPRLVYYISNDWSLFVYQQSKNYSNKSCKLLVAHSVKSQNLKFPQTVQKESSEEVLFHEFGALHMKRVVYNFLSNDDC